MARPYLSDDELCIREACLVPCVSHETVSSHPEAVNYSTENIKIKLKTTLYIMHIHSPAYMMTHTRTHIPVPQMYTNM